ncbi:GNAT family N-acetyltransferase [Streptomyces sp. NRRL F-5135]|uniref:GNAT family N-acetyltransferase n=1 Tax=Streptomyces sp. NRRL F-5135 TaxID=1463858 RepID=UPI00068DC376|nr:GNAT family N-acetyltransferase [Streptomyces sp. NRRL F-5135]
MEPLTLTTERLLLRPPVASDVDAIHAACQDPAIQRWTTVPSPYERGHAEDFVGRMVPDGWRDDTEYALVVQLRAGGPVIAALSLHHPRSWTWEIGYWTAREHRGRGYMTEAVTAMCRFAFTRLGAVRVEWRAEAGNTASRALAEKAGFVVEGILRGGLLNKNTLRDCWIGGLLPSDLGLPAPWPYLPAPDRERSAEPNGAE